MPFEHRVKSVFPPGFDSAPSSTESKSTSQHHTHSTEQLSIALIDNYSPITPSESVIVRSAWYGKQTETPRHEFILIQIEDYRNEDNYGGGLINYLILDRNVQNKSVKAGRSIGYSRTSVQGGQAIDSFKVSYDGDVERLLEDCHLNPHRLVEQLQFPSNKPLLLYELVTLANFVSSEYPRYHAINLSCYFFAGLIWDSLHGLYPGATLVKSLEKEKGKHGWFRYIVDKSQVEDTSKQASEKILEAKTKIEGKKSDLELWIQTLLNDRGAGRVASAQ